MLYESKDELKFEGYLQELTNQIKIIIIIVFTVFTVWL